MHTALTASRTRLSATLTFGAVAAALALSACSGMPGMSDKAAMAAPKPFSQDSLPDAVKVPAGHQVSWETVGVGEITYECRAKAGAMGVYEWAFVGPQAVLNSRSGQAVGSYYGPPATWVASDASKITGAQVAVAPASPGNIPLQLVKANPAVGMGAMTGVAFIQRVATQGGVAPASECGASSMGRKEVVKYQADYIFWKPV